MHTADLCFDPSSMRARPRVTTSAAAVDRSWPERQPPRLLVVREPRAPTPTWCEVHLKVVQLGRERAAHERELCRWLLEAERLEVHQHAGYASLREYAERVVGLSGRQAEERLRVGRALQDLPQLDRALTVGELCWSVVRELTRVATAETEWAWLKWAEGRRATEVERAVASRATGDGPDEPGDSSRLRHRLSFEVRPETLALFRDLQAQVSKDLGARVDDDTLLFEIARRALDGSGGEGRASYQIAVSRCDRCGAASLDAGGEQHRVDPQTASLFECDAQHIGPVDGAGAAPAPATVPERTADPGPHVGVGAPTKPTGQPAASGPQVGAPSKPTGRPAASSPHVGAPAVTGKSGHATQTIPPAVRRQVLRRDKRRCAVPGCHNHRFLDVHHVHERADGGDHDPERLITQCGAHHRAIHFGHLVVRGSASEGFRFYHADGRGYGAPLDPDALEMAEKVQMALVGLGFSKSQARDRVHRAQQQGGPRALQALLRAALAA